MSCYLPDFAGTPRPPCHSCPHSDGLVAMAQQHLISPSATSGCPTSLGTRSPNASTRIRGIGLPGWLPTPGTVTMPIVSSRYRPGLTT
jgi:hypothetical protein